jgi:hypothetical protein
MIIFFTVVITIAVSLFSAPFIWFAIVFIFDTVPSLKTIDLVGELDSIDPGAVVAACIYFCIALLVAFILHKHGKSSMALTVIISAIIMVLPVFALVSSLIWL